MKPQQGVECGSWVESPYESALSTSILLDEQLNRRHMTVMRVSGSCRQFLCETVSRLGVATTTHMLKGLPQGVPMAACASLRLPDRILPDVKPQKVEPHDPLDRVERV